MIPYKRWAGATDKNISNIFKVAEKDDLVVVLDEADTLFYNRAFAFQEHDIRFVNEMLQELERFDGMIILTTNMTELMENDGMYSALHKEPMGFIAN